MNGRKKKIIIICAVLLIVIAAAAFAAYKIIKDRDPNLVAKKTAEELAENAPTEISYDYDGKYIRRLGMYTFVPAKSAEYAFSVTDFAADGDVTLVVHIMDDTLSDIITIRVNTAYTDDDGSVRELTRRTTLQKSHTYYISFDIFPVDKESERYAGSFRLNASEAEEEIEEISEGGSVDLKVRSEGQSCVMFRPERTGYYRFDASIVSSDASSGFASIASVTSLDKKRTGLTEGICSLKEGNEYFIWTAVNETGKKSSKVRLTCSSLETIQAEGFGETEISGDTVIEFTAPGNDNLAVYSLSEGDPAVMVFEQPGFPLRTDDNSAGSLSENDKDFAVVIGTEKSRKYYICVYGKTTNCIVRMVKYTGDGSSLTIDDIEEPQTEEIPEAEEAEAEDAGDADGEQEQN